VPVQRMFDRWKTRFDFTSQELALSFRDMAEAGLSVTPGSIYSKRLGDVAGYVQYLRLMYELSVLARNFVQLDDRAYPPTLACTQNSDCTAGGTCASGACVNMSYPNTPDTVKAAAACHAYERGLDAILTHVLKVRSSNFIDTYRVYTKHWLHAPDCDGLKAVNGATYRVSASTCSGGSGLWPYTAADSKLCGAWARQITGSPSAIAQRWNAGINPATGQIDATIQDDTNPSILYSGDQLVSMMARGAAEYAIDPVAPKTFSANLVPASALTATATTCPSGPITAPPSATVARATGSFTTDQEFAINPNGASSVALTLAVVASASTGAPAAPLDLVFRDASTGVQAQMLSVQANRSPVHTYYCALFTVPAGGERKTYNLSFRNYADLGYALYVPTDVSFVWKVAQGNVPRFAAPESWVYIPPGTATTALVDPVQLKGAESTASNIWQFFRSSVPTPSFGPLASPLPARSSGTELYEVDTSALGGQSILVNNIAGNINANFSSTFLNVPPNLAPSQAQMLIPRELSSSCQSAPVDLGGYANNVTLPTQSCAVINPAAQGIAAGSYINLTVGITGPAGTYPVAFTWTDTGTNGPSGSALLTGDQFAPHLIGPITGSAITLHLQGSSTPGAIVTVRYWPWTCTPTNATPFPPLTGGSTSLANVSTKGCVMLTSAGSGGPVWLDLHQTGSNNGRYPTLSWTNLCSAPGSFSQSGSAIMTSDTNAPILLDQLSTGCPTIVKFNGTTSNADTVDVQLSNWTCTELSATPNEAYTALAGLRAYPNSSTYLGPLDPAQAFAGVDSTGTSAADLGLAGNQVVKIRDNACVRFKPLAQNNRTVSLHMTSYTGGPSKPLPFKWSKHCGGPQGSGTMIADGSGQATVSLGAAAAQDCYDIVKFGNNGADTFTLSYSN
jgi:hypothetical protein